MVYTSVPAYFHMSIMSTSTQPQEGSEVWKARTVTGWQLEEVVMMYRWIQKQSKDALCSDPQTIQFRLKYEPTCLDVTLTHFLNNYSTLYICTFIFISRHSLLRFHTFHLIPSTSHICTYCSTFPLSLFIFLSFLLFFLIFYLYRPAPGVVTMLHNARSHSSYVENKILIVILINTWGWRDTSLIHICPDWGFLFCSFGPLQVTNLNTQAHTWHQRYRKN